MKYLHIVFFIFLSSSVQARRLNYLEAHLLRFSSQQDPTHWLLPFSFQRKSSQIETNSTLSMQKDTYSLYKDIDSKNQSRIQSRLSDSFGQPYDVSAKLNAGFRYRGISQFISTTGGASLLVTDPVFPELKSFIYHDYAASTAYTFRPLMNLTMRPQVNYGVRRIMDKTYSAGDLVDKKLDLNFNKQPYIGFVEINLISLYKLGDWGHALFELTSLPLIQSEYQYWDTFLGYKTPNILKNQQWLLTELAFYGGYSPFYGGGYDVSRSYKIGSKLSISEWITADLFTMDEFYPASILTFNFTHLELDLFTFERAYDDFGNQKSRQYGLNLKTKW